MKRQELESYLGEEVEIEGTIKKIGVQKLPTAHKKEKRRALLIKEILINNQKAKFDHLWIKLGPNASIRASKWEDMILGSRGYLSAKIAYYQSIDQSRFGIVSPRNIRVKIGKKVKLLSRGTEQYPGMQIDKKLEKELQEYRYRKQRTIMEAIRALPKQDKALSQMLHTYFIKKMPVSAKQFDHAKRILSL